MIRKFVLLIIIVVMLSSCAQVQTNQESDTAIVDQDVPSEASEKANSNDQQVILSDEEESEVVESTQETIDEESTDPEEFFSDPNPLNLEMTYDESNAIEAMMDETGGLLELITREGTKFVLEIPENALLGPETIRMTPILTIDGFPLQDSNPVAVSLEPTGLIFFKPVTLTISGLSHVEGKTPFGFGTMGNGENFHLQMLQESDEQIVLYFSNFSDHGTASATQEEMERISKIYEPTQTASAASSLVDAIVFAASYLDEDNSDQRNQEKVWEIWDMFDFWYEFVMGKIEQAKGDPEGLEMAVASFLNWKQVYQDIVMLFPEFLDKSVYTDHFDSLIEKALNGLAEAYRNAFEDAYARCVSESEPKEAFRLYHHTLSADYLELWGRAGLEEDTIKAMLRVCFDFDFVFRSQVDVTAGDQKQLEQVSARIPLNLYEENSNFSFSGGVLQQEGEISYERIEIENVGTRCNLEKEPGILGIYLTFNTLNINYQEPWYISSIDLKIKLIEEPKAYNKCYVGTALTTVPVAYWHPFYSVHVRELYDDQGFVNISPLPIGFTPGVFAHKEISSNHVEANGTAKVISDYRLEHKPGR